MLLAFFLAITITGWFGTRVVRHAIFWHYHTDDPLRPWMNVPFIVHSYRVPPYVLVVAGSFVEQGEMDLWEVLVVASAAAVLGDQIGYGLGRLYGRRVVDRISRRFGGESRIKEAEALAARWGGAGIFLSRWLVTPLGRWLNLTSGIAHYPWHRYLGHCGADRRRHIWMEALAIRAPVEGHHTRASGRPGRSLVLIRTDTLVVLDVPPTSR